MKFTLRHLEVFLAVAKTQSISKAAEGLSMSQSAASAAIQEFENRYGIQLFDRGGKRLKLNRLGETMRGKAEQLMAQAIDFDRELLQREELGHLKVGTSYTIGNYLAFNYVAEYAQLYSKAKVDIVVGSTPKIIAKMLNYDVDVGLVEAEQHHEQLLFTPWRSDKMIAFCAPNHPLAGKSRLTDKDILAYEWILREPSSAHRQTFDRAMQGILSELNVRAELTHNDAVKNAVKAGLGLGCLSEMAVRDEIELGTLAPLELKNRNMDRHFYIVRHKGKLTNPALDAWVTLCNANVP